MRLLWWGLRRLNEPTKKDSKTFLSQVGEENLPFEPGSTYKARLPFPLTIVPTLSIGQLRVF